VQRMGMTDDDRTAGRTRRLLQQRFELTL